jgi:hypothetical protein
MGAFSIQINQDDMKAVRVMLDGIEKSIALVTMRSVNKTLTGVKTDASSAIREKLNVKKSAVDETFKITKATTLNLTAKFQSTGKPLALTDFIGTRQVQKGVSVQVRKDKSRTILQRGFIATMKSGHEGVFWREWQWHNKPSAKLNQFIPYARLPKIYRLPIREGSAPRVPDYLGDKGPIMKTVLTKANERLHNNLEHELEFELSKL